MDKINVVKKLNEVLKGEQMAVQAYEKFIAEVKDERIRNEFQQIQKDHREHISRLAERIQDIGAVPDYSTGMAGFFSNMKLDMETKSMDSYDILKKAYDGEDKGIAAVEEVIKGDLDDESMKLVKDILSTDHDHLKSMLSLMPENQIQ